MKKDAALLGGARVVSATSAFLSLLYLAKSRPVAEVGDINASLAAIQVIALLFGLGFSTSIIYFAKGAGGLARKLALFSYGSTLLLGMIAALCAQLIGSGYVFVLMSAVGIALIGQLSGYLQSLELYSKYALLLILQAMVLPFVNFVSIAVFREADFFSIYAFIVYVLFVLCGLGWMKKSPQEVAYGNNISLLKFFRYGINSLHFNLISSLYYSVDILILKFFVAAEFLGIYSAGASLAKSSWLVVDSIGQVVFPRRVAGKLSDAEYIKIARGCYMFSLAILVGWLFLGEYFLVLIFDDRYVNAYWPTALLLFGSIFLVYYKLESRLLAALNIWKVLTAAQLIGLLVSSVGVVVLSKHFSIVGSAFGQALGFVASAFVLFFLNKTKSSN